MRVTKYLFGFSVDYDDLNQLTPESLYRTLRKIAGKWCKLTDEKGVGTILYTIEGNKVYCQSLVKPKKIATIESYAKIEIAKTITFRVRLPVDIKTAHKLSGNASIDVNLNRRQLFELYIENLAKKNGMQLVSYRWIDLDNKQGLNPRPVLTEKPCADFTIEAIVEDEVKVKKAYVYGLGIDRDLGCGMMIINSSSHD